MLDTNFCTKKRMIISVIFLGLLTVLLLVLEEALTANEHTPTPTPLTAKEDNNNNNYLNQIDHENNNVGKVVRGGGEESNLEKQNKYLATPANGHFCWKKEPFTIVEFCSPCTNFEISSRSRPACFITGLKERVNCSTTGLVYRSCSRIPIVEKTRFIVFESLMLLLTIVFYGLVKLRTSQLERINARKLEKRLAANY